MTDNNYGELKLSYVTCGTVCVISLSKLSTHREHIKYNKIIIAHIISHSRKMKMKFLTNKQLANDDVTVDIAVAAHFHRISRKKCFPYY